MYLLFAGWAWWGKAHPRPTLHQSRPTFFAPYLALPCCRNPQQPRVPVTTQCQQPQRIHKYTWARHLCRSRSTRIVPPQVIWDLNQNHKNGGSHLLKRMVFMYTYSTHCEHCGSWKKLSEEKICVCGTVLTYVEFPHLGVDRSKSA